MLPSVCICDDDEELSSLLAQDLSAFGFDVTPIAINPDEAFQIVKEFKPQILLLDLRMPSDTGLHLLSRLGMLTMLAKTRVVMLTGEEGIFHMDKAMRLGASGYITKPYDREQLIATLTRLTTDPTLRWVDDISCLRSADLGLHPIDPADGNTQLKPGIGPVRVLSVEDNSANQELISLFLAGSGYAIDQAFTGRQAIEHASKTPYDVMFTDLRLPNIDGLEVLRSVRSSYGGGAKLPTIVLSADTMPLHVAAARAAGADDFSEQAL